MKEKNLIVYYSRSGNTEKVAKQIQRELGGDLFRVEPVCPYPEEYSQVTKQAKEEIQKGYLPAINISLRREMEYEKIFIGSPNWWNTMATPMKTALEEGTFKEASVFFFCTHGGGGIGNVFSDMEKSCGKKSEIEGLSLYEDGGKERESEVHKWLLALSK